MFPEITREDVFRLETRRLWLRWPIDADAEAAAVLKQGACAPEATAGDPYRPKDASRRVAQWRDANAAGTALHLVATGRGSDRRAIGVFALLPVRETIDRCGLLLRASLDPAHTGQGFSTEAVQALVDAAFLLTETPLVAASSRVLDPAFRRVLEKCGFAFCGTGLDGAPSGTSLVASDRFRLDRKAWASLKTWRVPGIGRDDARRDDEGSRAAAW